MKLYRFQIYNFLIHGLYILHCVPTILSHIFIHDIFDPLYYTLNQGWANFLTRGPQWVLKLDGRAGTKAWMECLYERCHVNTAAGEGAEGRAREPSALSAPRAR